MNFNKIEAAEVKLWDFSAYFWNAPRTAQFHRLLSFRNSTETLALPDNRY